MEISWYSDDRVQMSEGTPVGIEYLTPSGSSKIWLSHGEKLEVHGAGYIKFPVIKGRE